MKNWFVYLQLDSVTRVATITAPTALEALRIAKQKGYYAPMIGDV